MLATIFLERAEGEMIEIPEKSLRLLGNLPPIESPVSHLQLLEAVVEGTPDPVFAKDREGRFILVNSACAKVLGHPRSEVYGKVVSEFLDPASARHIEEIDARLFASGESLVAEESVVQDGRVRLYLTTKSLLKNASGEVIGLIGISHEITERKKMLEALGESEAQYRLLTEAMPQLVWMADANGALQYCNQHFRDVTGLSLEHAARFGYEAIHPEDRPAAKQRWNQALLRGESYETEYRLFNSQTSAYSWFSVRIHPVKDHSGNVLRWIGTAIDIDDKKNATLEMQKRERQLRMAQEAAHVGAWTWDEHLKQLSLSNAYYDLLGVAPGTPLSVDVLTQLILPEDLTSLAALFQSSSAGDLRMEYRIRKQNQIRWLLSIGRRTTTDSGASNVIAGITIDITDQKLAEEEMAKQAADLAVSNSDLQQFSSIASHDLQEPLRNIAICSELLLRSYRHVLDENGQQLLDLICSGARSGQVLTRALLSYARAVGSEGLEIAPVNLHDAYLHALSQLKIRIAESNAVITCGALPQVMGDGIQLAQLFQNLIENAIKYRGEAPPEIHVSSVRNQEEWIVSVKDNGVGVAKANLERIFRPFQRLRNAEIQGSGLGLATCSRIVERHCGRIWVESQPGLGSTFFFSLPAGIPGR